MFFTGTVSPQRYEYICKKYGFKNDGSQDNEIITKIHRLFLERIRKETGKSVKHWCVTEKGHTNTRRIHLHGLFYAREGQTKWQLTKLLYENWIDGYKYYGRYVNEKTIITYKANNGQDLPLPRYYKTTIYTDDQRQLLWQYAEDKGVKWVKGFEVIGANTVNKDYYERLLKEKNENGISLHNDNIEEIERKKAINQMAKLQNLTNRKKAQRRQIRREEEDIMYQYLSAEYCPF